MFWSFARHKVKMVTTVSISPPAVPTRSTPSEPSFDASAADPRWPSAYAELATVSIVILGIALRVLFLDADPHYYEWIGYITDEGRWTDAARQLALFGRVAPPVWSLHVVVAPLFELMSYVVFALSNVSVLSSRLLSAIAGCVVLVAFWVAFRRTTSPEALFLGIVPLAVQTDLVVLSRLAVPEMCSMALQFLLYLMITSKRLTSVHYFGIGLFSLFVVGMKITAAPVVAIFALLLIVQLLQSPPGTDRGWFRFFAYLAGLAAPVILLAAILLSRRSDLSAVVHSFRTVQTFLGATDPYGVLSFPFESPLASELGLLGLGFWYAVIGWQAARSAGIETNSQRHFLASAAWCVLYLGIMLVSSYFPDRYKVHIFIPMCITMAAGVGLLQRAGIMHAEWSFARAHGLRRIVGLAFLSLPTAIWVSPLLMQAVGVLGVEPFRLRIRIVALAASLIVVTLFLHWQCRRQGRLTVFLLFPVVAAFTWFAAQHSGLSDATLWPTENAPLSLPATSLLVAAAALSVAAAVWTRYRGPMLSLPAGIVLSATGYALLALIQLAPGYFTPHYSIRDTSRQLGTLLAGFSGAIATSGGDGLFRENRLHYSVLWQQQAQPDMPEVLVIAFPFADPEDRLTKEYCRISEYPLYVASDYYRANPKFSPESSLGEIARVYRKRTSPRCPDRAGP